MITPLPATAYARGAMTILPVTFSNQHIAVRAANDLGKAFTRELMPVGFDWFAEAEGQWSVGVSLKKPSKTVLGLMHAFLKGWQARELRG